MSAKGHSNSSLNITRMLRSPSHESITTNLSQFSISSIASENLQHANKINSNRLCKLRGAELAPSSKLQVEQDKLSVHSKHAVKKDLKWFEEENDVIRSCGLLSTFLGIQKSFSTSDITSQDEIPKTNKPMSSSDYNLSIWNRDEILGTAKFDYNSRSCSTWVAVGELATSQLPSPHGVQTNSINDASSSALFTTDDFVRSVNKKVRQNYIRKRLVMTYRALERLSQSEFNLDRIEKYAIAANSVNNYGPLELIVPKIITTSSSSITATSAVPAVTEVNPLASHQEPHPENTSAKSKEKLTMGTSKNHLTLNDIDRDRGRALTKYERNMLIFNWLHTINDTELTE